jgi:hypothetical protein
MKLRQLVAVLLTVVLLLQSSIVPSVAQEVIPDGVSSTGIASTDSQTNLYSVSGQVKDGSGNGIAGVTVTATLAGLGGDPPIVLLPGVMGTQLRNDPKAGNNCGTTTVNRGEGM